jgi:hypothetical protein
MLLHIGDLRSSWHENVPNKRTTEAVHKRHVSRAIGIAKLGESSDVIEYLNAAPAAIEKGRLKKVLETEGWKQL